MDWAENHRRDLFAFYRNAIQIRQNEPALQFGDFETLSAGKDTGLYVYRRFTQDSETIVALNASNHMEELPEQWIPQQNPALSEGYDGKDLVPWGFVIFANQGIE